MLQQRWNDLAKCQEGSIKDDHACLRLPKECISFEFAWRMSKFSLFSLSLSFSFIFVTCIFLHPPEILTLMAIQKARAARTWKLKTAWVQCFLHLSNYSYEGKVFKVKHEWNRQSQARGLPYRIRRLRSDLSLLWKFAFFLLFLMFFRGQGWVHSKLAS